MIELTSSHLCQQFSFSFTIANEFQVSCELPNKTACYWEHPVV